MTFTDQVKELYQDMIETLEEVFDINRKTLLLAIIGIAGALIVGGSWYWYRSRTASKAQFAQRILSECIDEYERARTGQGDWTTVDMMCKTAYERYGASRVMLYVIPFRVDALLALGQQEQALQLLEYFIRTIGSSSELYNLFRTKQALIKIDAEDPVMRDTGVQELTTLANDTQNKYRDEALYYLAQYYRSINQPDRAQDALKQLESMAQVKERLAQSPWARLAGFGDMGALPPQVRL